MEIAISDIYGGNSWKFICDRNLWNLFCRIYGSRMLSAPSPGFIILVN